MFIEYSNNPLCSKIILDDVDKKELKYKIRINLLEEIIVDTYYNLEHRFDIDRAKKSLKISNGDINIDTLCDEMYNLCIHELSSSHSGDCTCVPSSCGKCWAESLVGIDTIAGLGKLPAHYIELSFRNSNNAIDALKYLRTYNPVPENSEQWKRIGGYEQYIERWKSEISAAYEWLLNHVKIKLKENIMNKEQYLAIVASWKSFIKEGKHKKYKVFYDYTDFCTHSIENGKAVSWTTHKDYGYKWQSNLTPLHHLIYTLIRKRDVLQRFSEESVRDIVSNFESYICHASKYQEYVSSILEPFGGNITIDEIRDLITEFRNRRIR